MKTIDRIKYHFALKKLTPEMFGRTAITGNAMNVIMPFRKNGTWVFDDHARGLVEEPFVLGIPEMIDEMLKLQGIEDDMVKFIFSENEFPEYHASIKKTRNSLGGAYYRVHSSNIGTIDLPEGWLCPATLLYFRKMPKYIYLRIETVDNGTSL